MIFKIVKYLFRFLIFCGLTIITQIGGLVYLVSLLISKRYKISKKRYRFSVFLSLYLFFTFLIIPILAPLFGRERIEESNHVKAHSFFYKLLNRNYVKPELNDALQNIALEFNKTYYDINIVYLDANFPFLNKFPLLPHLSHNDGKKIDLTLIYQTKDKKITNKKRSRSGYGIYESPKKGEVNQIEKCKKRGYWQYDFPQYLTLGSINKDLEFSELATRDLILQIVKQTSIKKVFIEPHLKTRLGLKSSKIRYHGCQAVRHDDHIHVQL
jgi:hypothetical protein